MGRGAVTGNGLFWIGLTLIPLALKCFAFAVLPAVVFKVPRRWLQGHDAGFYANF